MVATGLAGFIDIFQCPALLAISIIRLISFEEVKELPNRRVLEMQMFHISYFKSAFV